jgi:hypothetical protein
MCVHFAPFFCFYFDFHLPFFLFNLYPTQKKVLILFSQPLLLLTPHAREKEEEDKKYIKTAHMPLAAWEYDNRPTRSLFCRPAERKRKKNKTGKGRKKVERDLMFLSVVCLWCVLVRWANNSLIYTHRERRAFAKDESESRAAAASQQP